MHTRTIKLSNGSLTLSGDFNLFTLSKSERFNFGCIIDYFNGMEEASARAQSEIRSINKGLQAQAPPEVTMETPEMPRPLPYPPYEEWEGEIPEPLLISPSPDPIEVSDPELLKSIKELTDDDQPF